MTTIEIISNFMKGNSKVTITQRQLDWLLGQAKKEKISVGFNGSGDTIYFSDCMYSIKQCSRLASGGSYVGSKLIQGKYNIEKLYAIRFTENSKHTAVYGSSDLEHFKRENIGFEIIKPHVNTNTRNSTC